MSGSDTSIWHQYSNQTKIQLVWLQVFLGMETRRSNVIVIYNTCLHLIQIDEYHMITEIAEWKSHMSLGGVQVQRVSVQQKSSALPCVPVELWALVLAGLSSVMHNRAYLSLLQISLLIFAFSVCWVVIWYSQGHWQLFLCVVTRCWQTECRSWLSAWVRVLQNNPKHRCLPVDQQFLLLLALQILLYNILQSPG